MTFLRVLGWGWVAFVFGWMLVGTVWAMRANAWRVRHRKLNIPPRKTDPLQPGPSVAIERVKARAKAFRWRKP